VIAVALDINLLQGATAVLVALAGSSAVLIAVRRALNAPVIQIASQAPTNSNVEAHFSRFCGLGACQTGGSVVDWVMRADV
jgi:hypothetical protein